MKKVVIIGANEFQNKLIKKAKELGYETHVFAWQCGDIGEKTADYFYPISIIEKDKILLECKKIKPDAVISIASDLASITVDYVSDKLCLTLNNTNFTSIRTNKYEMRKALKDSGIFTPEFEKVSNIENCSLKTYPLIVKPTDRSGSRAISLVNNDEELKNAIDNAIANSFEKKAIVEEVIYGNEYSCECISYNGKHTFLTITKKYTTGFPKCIETGHVQPSDLNDDQIEKVKCIIFKSLDALKIENGASHSEFKIDKDGNIKIIEIGARMGGDCIGSDLVYVSTGLDYLEMVINVGLGKEPDLKQKKEKEIAMIKFIFSQNDIDKMQKIIEEYRENIYYISKINKIEHEVIDSSSRYGFYIMKFDDNEAFEKVKKEVLL